MVKIFENKTEIIGTAAELFVQVAQQAIAASGRFTVALTGGTSPEALYNLLATAPYEDKIDWTKVFIFFGDERWVPLTDDKSNGKMANRTLIDKLPVQKSRVFYMWGEGQSPEEFAAGYEQSVRQVLGSELSFDLIMLGMGAEGHTASLFPHEPVLTEKTKLVMAYYLQSQSMYRITFTEPLINKAKHILVMLFGQEKAAALHEVLEGEHNPDLYPAQLLAPRSGDITWLVDKEAAKNLNSDRYK